VLLHNKPKAAVHAGTFMLTGTREEEEVQMEQYTFVDFKLSSCSERLVLSSG
jgi:hypothetical protein